MLKHSLGLALTAAVLAGGAAPQAGAAGEKVVLAPTAVELPVKLGPLHLTGEPHKYEPASLGVSYQFSGRGLSLTIYVYDADVKDIHDGGDSVEACEQVEEAKHGVIHAKYPNTVLTREQMVRLLPNEDFPLAREARYELEREGRPAVSYIWVTAVAQKFIKLRFSFDKQLSDEELDARSAILEALGEAIKPHLASARPEAKTEEGPGMSITMGFDGDVTAAMLYTTLLSSVLEQTPELVPPCGGTVVPPFDVDVGVLRAVMEMSAQGMDSKFAERLATIDKAGFLEEFVWNDMHREEWGTSEPADLAIADYLEWKKKHLKRFRRPELGSVTVSHPKPLPLEGSATPTTSTPATTPTPAPTP